jgi:rSAM/selenodomain-associated transferase 1
VLLVAKAPSPGRTKTRLSPPLSPEEASELGAAMLLDTLEGCRREADEVGILHARSDEAGQLRGLLGTEIVLVEQRGTGLRDALCSGAEAMLDRRSAVALVAPDVPGIPPGALERCWTALEAGADVVLGPGHDGGYWLVGLREPLTAPFEDIPWSTPAVLETTLARCGAAGLAVELLEPWRDIDTPADLDALAPLAESLPGSRTAALLRRHAALASGV